MKLVLSDYTIISVDPGYDRLGVAVLKKENGKEKLLYSSCIVSSRKENESDRIFFIGKTFKEIFKLYKPEALIIEKIFINSNQATGLVVANICGVLKYIAAECGVPVFEYTPTAVKMALVGHGRAGKGDVHLMVERLLSLSKKRRLDDEIDAIAVGLTHLAHARIRE